MRRLFRRRAEPLPPPGATPDEAATQPITAVREEVATGPRLRPPRIWPWLVALLVLVLAGIAAAYVFTREDDDDDATPAPTAAVPDVVGLRAEEASRRLVADGFRARLARAPSERPRGLVLSQRPPARSRAERGSAVTLVVSQGPERIAVPDVVGLPLARAFRRVEAARLRPQARRVFSNRPRGRVIRQRPAAGTKLEREQVVLVTVSRGPGRVDVPEVTGLSEAQAAAVLRAAGLDANVVRVASSEPAGTVVAQRPRPGARSTRGTAIRLNVSRGPSGTTTTTTTTTATATTTTGTTSSVATVPNVVGLNEQAADRRLSQAGFTVRASSRATMDPAEDGIVLEQRPTGGASARVGAQVTITIGALTP